jgi:hypothetical protein
VLSSPDALNMTSTEIRLIASVYLVGEIIGRWFSAGCRPSWGCR